MIAHIRRIEGCKSHVEHVLSLGRAWGKVRNKRSDRNRMGDQSRANLRFHPIPPAAFDKRRMAEGGAVSIRVPGRAVA